MLSGGSARRSTALVRISRYGARRSPAVPASRSSPWASRPRRSVSLRVLHARGHLVWRRSRRGASSFVKLVAVVANSRGRACGLYQIPRRRRAGAERYVTSRHTAPAASRCRARTQQPRARGGERVGSGNYFVALGGVAVRGRLLLPSDADDGAPPVVVISERLWRAAFAQAENVVGRPVHVNGAPATIAGVVRPEFIGLRPVVPDLWMPVTLAARRAAAPRGSARRADEWVLCAATCGPGAARAGRGESRRSSPSPRRAGLSQRERGSSGERLLQSRPCSDAQPAAIACGVRRRRLCRPSLRQPRVAAARAALGATGGLVRMALGASRALLHS